MPRRFTYSETVDQAARVLFAHHKVSVSDEYGKCIAPGYIVDESAEGMVRVSHRTPEPDLLDDDRMSDDEMATERHRMIGAYAATLEAAGYVVERKGPRSRKPYVLARRPLEQTAVKAVDEGLDNLFRRLGPPDA